YQFRHPGMHRHGRRKAAKSTHGPRSCQLKARRSKYGIGGHGSRGPGEAGPAARSGSGGSGGPGGSGTWTGARGPRPSREISGPKISRGPGARAAGRKNRGGENGSSARNESGRIAQATSAGRPGAAPHVGSSVEGVVSANRAGYGFLRVEGMKDSV